MNKPASVVQRRLAAIFSADVAGYTRLMNADEPGTLRLLTTHREMTDRLIQQHGGRIANTAGDSILAEFPSVVDALQCALSIQERIAAVHEEVPEERRVSFRIGLHVGEAMVRDGDLFGDGVNVAARMQSLAEPGSVCLSGSAHEYVHRVLPISFEEIGPQFVKNLSVPIRAFLARPPGQLHARAIPPVHRSVEIHLARRFHEVCYAAVAEVTGREGLKPIDLAIMASLDDVPGLDAQRLAERTGIEVVRLKRIVQRLRGHGIIEQARIDDRGRSPGLRLSSRGRKVRQKLRPAVTSARDRLLAPLSEHEREMLKEFMARVIKAAEIIQNVDEDEK